MAMLDSLFNKGFKAAKCKTLIKLTIPRIKLLRNRREIQIKQMRKDIAKLLETGQEATARIRVEHIIREENFTAAQEIVELFCELISVRLPIIEIQRECPLDLKEAISSVCFAAPRCADLPELMQVQMLFGFKYGKEFITAATELLPESGVNRQLIELLSIRAPPPDKKLKLLKDIAEEHGVEWDPAATEAELHKIHDDLLNGEPQFVSGAKLPIPQEKHADHFDGSFDSLEFPEVPKPAAVSFVPVMSPIPFENSFFDLEPDDSPNQEKVEGLHHRDAQLEESPPAMLDRGETSQSVPEKTAVEENAKVDLEEAMAEVRLGEKVGGNAKLDLEEVIAAARVAAENAESAAAAARTAASLAQSRMSELTRENDGKIEGMSSVNPFSSAGVYKSEIVRLPSIEDETAFTYPNLFSSSNV